MRDIDDSHSGATQFGRNNFWSSMKEKRVWAISIFAVKSSSIYKIVGREKIEGHDRERKRKEQRREECRTRWR